MGSLGGAQTGRAAELILGAQGADGFAVNP